MGEGGRERGSLFVQIYDLSVIHFCSFFLLIFLLLLQYLTLMNVLFMFGLLNATAIHLSVHKSRIPHVSCDQLAAAGKTGPVFIFQVHFLASGPVKFHNSTCFVNKD